MPTHQISQPVNAVAAASRALLLRRQLAFIVGSVHAAEQPPPSFPVEPRSVVTSPTVTTAEPTSLTQSDVWACIAEAETGSDYTMHGSTYSTAFGMVNDIIYDYGTPEEQQAVFSGTASKEQQIAIASRFAGEHGFGGWGKLTKQKCGL